MKEEFIVHEGEKYRVIDSKEYCLAHRRNLLVGSKFASITARKGRVGERVTTIMKDGFTETTNMVTYDTATGEPDWVVKQASGEEMIVSDSKFKQLYHLDGEVKEGDVIKPSGVYRPMILLDENVAVKTSWGETQYIKKGGVLVVIGENDIYGIQEREFYGSYNVVDADANSLFDENITKKAETRKPTIFLSVAYPYENQGCMNLLREVVAHLNKNGVRAVNIRKIEHSNNNLITEINDLLKECEGILSLAFNKGNNLTSPFIHIETALAAALNLESLMIVPQDVVSEGMLFEENVAKKSKIVDTDKSLYDSDNQDMLSSIDQFIEHVIKRYELKIDKKDLLQFKKGILNQATIKSTQENLVSFLKNFYGVKEQEFDFSQIYVKRPVKIKAMIIEESGYYDTQDGKIYLSAGDFLVEDIDASAKPYGVKAESFKARYMKVSGEENTYVTKFIPTIATKHEGKTEVYSLIDTEDVYSMSSKRFEEGYQSINDYLLNLEDEKVIEDMTELE